MASEAIIAHNFCNRFLFFGKKFPPNREPLRVKGNRFSFGASLLALAQGRAHPVFAGRP
jgi:hypothetical protein